MLRNLNTGYFYIGQIDSTHGGDLYEEVKDQLKRGECDSLVDKELFLGAQCIVMPLYTIVQTSEILIMVQFARKIMEKYTVRYQGVNACVNKWPVVK